MNSSKILRNRSSSAVKAFPVSAWTVLLSATALSPAPAIETEAHGVDAAETELLPIAQAGTHRAIVHYWTDWGEPQQQLSALSSPEKYVPIENPSATLSAVLGKYGIDRLREFQSLPPRWGAEDRRSLSPASLASLDTFVSVFSDFASEPSVFLTPSGNIELNWEDAEGSSIQLEFLPDGIEYYIQSTDTEGIVPLAIKSIRELAERLTALS